MEKIFEIVRIKQVTVEKEEKRFRVASPSDASEFIQTCIADDDREVFFVVCLNTKNEVIACHRAHVGSLNASIVQPREVFKAAILNNSASIIIAHQHPSGNVSPSPEDISVTERLVKAGEYIGINVLDHIIVSQSASLSLKERGYV